MLAPMIDGIGLIPRCTKKGLYLPYNKILKNILKVPVITAGRMDDPDRASNAIINGQTDMVALGRPLLADADIPNKIRADRLRRFVHVFLVRMDVWVDCKTSLPFLRRRPCSRA